MIRLYVRFNALIEVLNHPQQHSLDERFLGGEVVQNSALAGPAFVRYGIQGQSESSITVDDFVGRLE